MRIRSAMAPILTRAYARFTAGSSLEDREAVRALAERWTVTTCMNGHTWTQRWMGVPILQQANDLLILQELIYKTRPKVVIETGTFGGGSAIFYASILSLCGGGRVISVDIEHGEQTGRMIAEHPLGSAINLVTGDSADPQTYARVHALVAGEPAVMVALDSNHQYAHVLAELRAYADLVSPGGYLVVFDTITEALTRVSPQFGRRDDHPGRAIGDFLRERPDFRVDTECDRLLVSYCRGGFLRRGT